MFHISYTTTTKPHKGDSIEIFFFLKRLHVTKGLTIFKKTKQTATGMDTMLGQLLSSAKYKNHSEKNPLSQLAGVTATAGSQIRLGPL